LILIFYFCLFVCFYHFPNWFFLIPPLDILYQIIFVLNLVFIFLIVISFILKGFFTLLFYNFFFVFKVCFIWYWSQGHKFWKLTSVDFGFFIGPSFKIDFSQFHHWTFDLLKIGLCIFFSLSFLCGWRIDPGWHEFIF
jgi:hypothetical protein